MDSEFVGTWKITLEIQGSRRSAEQLNMYRQYWQADQQKHIIAKMAGKGPSKSNDGKMKNNHRNHHNSNG
jgi:hypothetical protein